MKLKVCGMKYADNIKDVAKLAPDFMGFIFYPKSKRFVGEDFIMPELFPPIAKVGIFVNDSAERIREKVKKYKLDYVQLHGDETAAETSMIAKELERFNIQYTSTMFVTLNAFGAGIIKAFSIDESFDFSIVNDYEKSCDFFLFDTKSNDYGGSGKKFNWEILKKYDGKKQFILSGGIDLNDFLEILNLKSQIPTLFAIDLNSKFETEPGLKDISKLKILKDELSGK